MTCGCGGEERMVADLEETAEADVLALLDGGPASRRRGTARREERPSAVIGAYVQRLSSPDPPAALAKRPPITRAVVGKAWIVSARTESGTRSLTARTAS